MKKEREREREGGKRDIHCIVIEPIADDHCRPTTVI